MGHVSMNENAALSLSNVKISTSNRNDARESQNSSNIAPFLGRDKEDTTVDKIRPFKPSKQG